MNKAMLSSGGVVKGNDEEQDSRPETATFMVKHPRHCTATALKLRERSRADVTGTGRGATTSPSDQSHQRENESSKVFSANVRV